MTSAWRAAALSLTALLAAGSVQAQSAKDTVTILREQDADRYDPARTSARSAGEVIYMLADTLVSLDYDQKTLKPGLAKSWDVSPDGKLYTFHLREDVSFCDGRKMTADDVVYSIKRWTDPATKSPVASRAGAIKELRAPDPYTVEYELKEPSSELLYQLTLFFASIVDKNTVEALGADFGVKGFNGTGPYCWVSWEPRNQVILKRNPAYKWGPPIYKNQGPAQPERIIWRVVPEENTRIAALQTGQADITQYVPEWAVAQLDKMPTLQVKRAKEYFWAWFMGFKVNHEVVSDFRVRRALNMAVDQNAIAKSIFFGVPKGATTYVDSGTLDFDPAVNKVTPVFNPEGAKKLLDEAGWKMGADGFREKDGKKLSILLYGISTPRWQKMLEAVQGDMRKVGAELRVQLFDATIAWGKMATQEFDVFAVSYPYFSAGDALNLYFPSTNMPSPNRMNWKDEETDAALAEGRAATDPKVRAAAYSKALLRVHEQAVWIPLLHEPLTIAASKRLTGVEAHGVYGVGLYKGLDIAITR